MHPRLSEEWVEIVSIYPDAKCEGSPERVIVTLELDGGSYNRLSSPTAVLVPPGYRATGPDSFLVPNGLQFANGSPLPASDATGVGMPGWQLVSFHYIDANGQSTWRPTADPTRGDNFVSYLNSIEAFFARGCN